MAGSILGFQQRRVATVRFDRFTLPAFDAYAYVAMAEEPAVFTLAPWGYRLLTPAAARALPGHSAGGYRYLTAAALLAASVLLFVLLRRLGADTLPALLGVAVFAVSAPAKEALALRFLVEPVTVALFVAFLLALETGAGTGRLALLLALGTLSKEAFLAFAPAVAFARWRGLGARRALATALLAAAPAVAGAVALRRLWQPHLALAPAPPGMEALRVVLGAWRDWLPALALFGLTPVALLAVLTPGGRALLGRHGYALAVALLLPFAAGVYVSRGEASHFFTADVHRLLIYAVPLLVALASCVPRWLSPEAVAPRAPHPAAEIAAFVAAAAVAGAPLLLVDPYRRLDLGGPRDGPYVMGFCRETLRAARRLARGEEVAFDASRQRFAWGVSDPSELHRLRWFLREGWGERAHYGQGDMVMAQGRAELVLPARPPRDLAVDLSFDVPRPLTVFFSMEGRALDQASLVAGPQEVSLRLPAAAQRRGDNLLVLAADPGLRLRALRYRPL